MWNRGLLTAVIAAGLLFGAPRASSASEITIDFSGKAYYFDYLDPTYPGNDPLPFQVALTALGVVQGTSPVLVSLTFDSSAPLDAFGNYHAALVGGSVNLGPGLEYRIGPADVSVSPFTDFRTTTLALADGPTLHTSAMDLFPTWAAVGFPFFDHLTAASLSDALSDPMLWPTIGFALSFDGNKQHFSQGNIVYSGLQVTSVKVPEPAAILNGLLGLTVGWVLLRRARQPRLAR